jgi:protein involved in polysaccharide export with SLBB domain
MYSYKETRSKFSNSHSFLLRHSRRSGKSVDNNSFCLPLTAPRRILIFLPLLLLTSLCLNASAQEAVSTTTIDTATERQAPEALEALERTQTQRLKPFGFNLFTGGFRAEREDGLNPDYIIVPGDRITVRIWGATEFDQTLVVDSQGNIFIPQIGPIRVWGVRNDQLTEIVERAVRTVFTQNVSVYTNVEGTLPVAVYVTGFVQNPGSYAGVASDSILYFVDRAGGVDLERGSFRDIRVQRKGKVIARVDTYQFLLEGEIPRIQFTDGDTVVVGRRGPVISVEGDVVNAFQFEILAAETRGADLVQLAQPTADASHAAIVGTREKGPVSAYVPLGEFTTLQIRNGDRVIIEADEREDTMMVRIEGSHLGPSRFAVPINTRLVSLLDHVEVDRNLADVTAVSLKRQSVAQRQKSAIEESLRRLENAVLGATSQTVDESKIRVEEAKLITEFVERARQVKPEGVLVVSKAGRVEDVLLQPEDIITIPENTRVVLVSGEVIVPQAVVHEPNDSILDYIAKVGGFSDRAKDDEFLVIRRNAEVLRGRNIEVRPGDEIVVLPKIPTKNLEIAKTIIQVIYQLALSTAIAFGVVD